jgi:hypothetical protein
MVSATNATAAVMIIRMIGSVGDEWPMIDGAIEQPPRYRG